MRTAPQPRADRYAPDGEALYRALDMTPAEVTAVEQGEQAGKRRGRVRLFSRHQPRHAVPAEGAEMDGDAETAAMEFREMRLDEPVPAPAPRRTGPQRIPRATGPMPSFTPAPGRQTGPQRRARHARSGPQRRLPQAPPPPPREKRLASFAQAQAHIAALDYPAYDAADGYGSIPSYIALMRQVSHLTNTSSPFEHPGAWPLPGAPAVRRRGLAITVKAAPEPPATQAQDDGLPAADTDGAA